MELSGVLCEIPPSSRTLAGESLQITSNVLHAWVRPHRLNSATSGPANAEFVRTDSLDEAAWVDGGDVLGADFPGLSGSLGAFGAANTLVASDVTIYTIYEKVNSGESNPATLSVFLNASAISGHSSLNLNGSGTAVDSQEIGDHLTDWSDLQTLSVRITGATGTQGVFVKRILLRAVFRSNEVLSSWRAQKVFRSQQGFIESAVSATDDYQNGGYLLPAGQSTEPFRNPADQVEVILRNRNWGLGLTAPEYTDSGSDLASPVGNGTSWEVDDGTDFAEGDVVLCDAEVVRVTSISGNTLTVERGCDGSRPECHDQNTDLYLVGSDGEVNTGSFRGAAGILRHETGDDLVSGGEMEAFSSGVAAGWTKDDASSHGSFAADTGYARRYGQKITRTSAGDTVGIYQDLTCTLNGWYLLRGWYKGDAVVYVSSYVWSLESADDWTEFEIPFQAYSSSMRVHLRVGATAGDEALFDEVSCRALTDWCWDHSVDAESDSYTWLDRACSEAKLRLIEDGTGRTAARVWWFGRESTATWDESILVAELRGAKGPWRNVALVKVSQTPAEDVATAVRVRYGYDHLQRTWTSVVDVSASRENTGETVMSYTDQPSLHGGGTLVVSGTSGLFPAGRWTSGQAAATASGTPRTVLAIAGATFLTDGVEAGDWLWVKSTTAHDLRLLAMIESVDSETQVTLSEPLPELSAHTIVYTAMPNLLATGGAIFLPVVGGGPGAETTTLTVYMFLERDGDWITIPASSSSVPSAGEAIWKLTSTSSDGAGVRDQALTVGADRERRAMVRLATTGTPRVRSVDAARIRERETAVALRDHLFDLSARRYVIDVTTDFSTVDHEVGDAVTLEHELVPGGSLRVELLRQELDLENGVIRWRGREL